MVVPDFIMSAVKTGNTSLGNNGAFAGDSVGIVGKLLNRRAQQVFGNIVDKFGYVPTVDEAYTRLSRAVRKAMEHEKPLRDQLETLCKSTVSSMLGTPQETILLDCMLVNEVSPGRELRIMPEEEGPSYVFSDAELDPDDEVLRRRMVDCMVQGISYLLMTASYDSDKLSEWDSELPGLYAEIIALNDLLLFTKEEEISDRNPMLGAYVEVDLGEPDDKTVIDAQGLVYPLLLQEAYRGFFELFGSHGLPDSASDAMYIIRRADFTVAEAWDLRLGVPVWQSVDKMVPDDIEPSMYPYIFTSLAQLDVYEFNDIVHMCLVGDKEVKGWFSDLVGQVRHDDEYNLFKKDIEKFNFEKCLITDTDEDNQTETITEGLSQVLYHFTSLDNGYNICKDDTIFLQSAFAKDADNYDRKRKYYLSCTRVRSSEMGFSRKFNRGGVRIVLDGTKLANKFKGKHIQYWGGDVFTNKYSYYNNLPKNKEELDSNLSFWVNKYKKEHPEATQNDIDRFVKYNFNRSAQEHIDNESEDRLFSYEPSIEQAHKYIISVDVFLPKLKESTDQQRMAYSFIARTPLNRKVRIFDTLEQFNSPNGKDCNDEVEYMEETYPDKSWGGKNVVNVLSAVIGFISWGNSDFEGDRFGKATGELLDKYGLGHMKGYIGHFNDKRNGSWTGPAEALDAVRRELSDEPSREKSNILKMLTDHIREIGANSFPEAVRIKKMMADKYASRKYGGYPSERIDTQRKERVLVNPMTQTIVLYPKQDTFQSVMGWNDEWVKANAEYMAQYAFYEPIENLRWSGNDNSLRMYLWKIFKRGNVPFVMNELKKIGFSEEYLQSYNISFEYRELDYYEATRYYTPTARKIENYRQRYKENDREIEEYFEKTEPNKENNIQK
jgi:hypothetical protein